MRTMTVIERKIGFRTILPFVVFLSLLAAFLTIGSGILSYGEETADDQARVYDQAGLFPDNAIEAMETEIASMRLEMKMDVAVVTTEAADGKTAKDYAENFYIEKNLGTGDSYNGVLFLMDMDNREIYIDPVGAMNRFLTDNRVDAVLDAAYEEIAEGNYEACANEFLKGVRKYYKAGIPSGQYNYDEDTGKISVYRSIRWYEALLAFAAAGFTAWLPCRGIRNSYAMKKERKQANNYLMAYRADCQFHFANRTDDLVNKSVTHIIIPRNDNNGPGHSGGGGSFSGRSTTHTSSGRSFGGGGRKF